jgi:hypothetical protein
MMNQFFLAPSADSSPNATSDPTPNPATSIGPNATSNFAPNSAANAGPSTLTVTEQQCWSLLPDLSVDEQHEILLDWLEMDNNIRAVLGMAAYRDWENGDTHGCLDMSCPALQW